MLKGQKGITLVALIITIIVLIILAGISISLVLTNDGIFGRAIQAREEYANGEYAENKELTNAFKALDERLNALAPKAE